MVQGGEAKYAEYREKILEQASFRKRAWHSLPHWVSFLADLLGIAAVVAIPFLGSSEHTIASFSLVGVAVLAFLAAIVSHHRGLVKARYATAMRSLHLAIHILRDEAAFANQWKDEHQIKDCLSEVLHALATAFTIVVEAPCRACIKVIDFVPPEGMRLEDIPAEQVIEHCYARTFCRDSATHRQIGKLPEGPRDAPVRHNTAFRFLFEDVEKRFFIGNNLPKMAKNGHYQNTSMQKYGNNDDQWSLPYRATMVWPIRMIVERSHSEHMTFTGEQVIFGYLAVDTHAVNVFSKYTDFEVGAMMADALFLFLSFVYPVQREETRDAGQKSAVAAEPRSAAASPSP